MYDGCMLTTINHPRKSRYGNLNGAIMAQGLPQVNEFATLEWYMNVADQRVIRTRRQLQNSFIALVNECGFEAVSIRDVTAHAGVGYRTFFRHYKDTRELLEDALAQFIDEVTMLLVPPDSLDMMERNVITMYQYIEKNADLFRAFYRSPFFEESDTMQSFGRKVTRNIFGNTSIPSEIVQSHFYYSMMNLQRWWVENNMPISAEKMGRYAHDLIVRPIIILSAEPAMALP